MRTTSNRGLVFATAALLGGPRLVRLLTQDPAGRALGYDNPYLLIRDPDFATVVADDGIGGACRVIDVPWCE